ncbi:response regulator [Nibricoccus sp. IMCC34717]|uniref:response regulator n=1 Tax=Nibricoccus sp. IMCC34717 TaxID=3034021 RepID=UPI00384E8B88
MPQLIGYPRARVVDEEVTPRSSRHRVYPPEFKTLRNRLTSLFEAPMRVRETADLLTEHGENLRARYAEIEARRKELEAIIQASADGIVIVRQGVVCFANPAFGRLVSAPLGSDLRGRRSSDWLQMEDIGVLREWAQKNTPPVERREVKLATDRGDMVWVDLSAPRSIEWSGEVCTLWMLRPVRSERAIDLAAAEAAEREQRRIADDLHDGLGQEMTGIAIQLKLLEGQLARQGLGEAARVAQLVQLTSQAARHARDIAHGLSPRIVVEQGLVAALNWLAAHATDLFGMQVSVESTVDDAALRKTFPVQRALAVYRAMQEVVSNARRHGRADSLTVRIAADGQELSVVFTDSGVGLSAVTQERPAGMGLKILEQRMAKEGGSVRIFERTDGTSGTVVALRLPWVSTGKETPGAPAQLANTASTTHSERLQRVAIIDDHPVVREGVATLVESSGRFAVVLKTGSVDEFLSHAEPFDIAVVDLMLGALSGLDVIRQLRSRTPSVAIVAYSMGATELYRSAALEAGASAFVTKDALPEELLGCLDSLG